MTGESGSTVEPAAILSQLKQEARKGIPTCASLGKKSIFATIESERGTDKSCLRDYLNLYQPDSIAPNVIINDGQTKSLVTEIFRLAQDCDHVMA